MANVGDWQKIHSTIKETYSDFEQTSKLNLTDEKCKTIRAYFQDATETAQNLQNHIYYSGILAAVSITVSLGSSWFSKRYPIVNTISTLFLVVAIGSAAWFSVHYIKKQNLQKLFYAALLRSENRSEKTISDDQLKKVVEVIQGGCMPELSVTDVNGEACSLLGACIAKGSYKAAILVAALYKDKQALAQHATESVVFIKNDRFKNDEESHLIPVCLLEQLGAKIDTGDSNLLNKSAALLNIVAIEELLRRGAQKDGGLAKGASRKKAPMEYAIDSAISQKRRVEDLLKVFGVTDYSKYTTKEALANYLNEQGVLISDDYAQKILDLLNEKTT